MKLQFKTLAMAGMLAACPIIGAGAAHAQVPAALPTVENVAPGEATSADGTYVVSTINKRITIENGRAFVVDPWTTALIFRVKEGMVTLRNFRQTGADTFEADDLPMMGKVVFNRQPNGTLQGVVKGAMGEAKYALVPTEYAGIGDGNSGGGPGDGNGDDLKPQTHTYRLHVSAGNCTGKQLTRKKFNGTVTIWVLDPESDRLNSRNRNYRVDCKDKGDRSQTYSFYENGPGALTIRTTPDLAGFTNLHLEGKYNALGQASFRKASDLLSQVRAKGRPMRVGEQVSDWQTVVNNKTKLKFKVTIERVD